MQGSKARKQSKEAKQGSKARKQSKAILKYQEAMHVFKLYFYSTACMADTRQMK
jgi:hypothetical protein